MTGASGADSVVGTVSLESVSPLKGIYSARFPNVASSYLREDFTGVDEVFVSFYIKVNQAPSATSSILAVYNGSTRVGLIQLLTNGKLRLSNNGSPIGADSATLTYGTIYRVGLRQKKGSGANGIIEGYLATGDGGFTTFASSTVQSFTTQATRVHVGATYTALTNMIIDSVRIDSVAMPGPD